MEYQTLAKLLECSPMARETWVQSQVESYQRLKKWYLMPPCLTLSIIRYGSKVKWSNLGKGVVPSPTPWCSKLSKREPSGHPRLWSPTLLKLCEDTGCCPEDLPRAMNDREEWRERVRDIRATSATWWWWWWYTYFCQILFILIYFIHISIKIYLFLYIIYIFLLNYTYSNIWYTYMVKSCLFFYIICIICKGIFCW